MSNGMTGKRAYRILLAIAIFGLVCVAADAVLEVNKKVMAADKSAVAIDESSLPFAKPEGGVFGPSHI